MRILCIGDSNTYGFDPRSYLGDRYPAEVRWADRLGKHEVINCGVNGMTVPCEHSRYVAQVRINDPDLVIVMLGTNDLLQGASAKEAAARMEAFLNSLLPYCKQILLVAPPPMKRGAWVPTDELVVESVRLAEEYKILAEKLNIPFVDTHLWNIELTFDGVHFTEEGHHAFAENLRKELLQLAGA